LTATCIAENAGRIGRQVDGISAEVPRALQAHDWPGNIRELRNVIERAVVLCPGGELRLDDLPDPFHPAGTAVAPPPVFPPDRSPAQPPAPSLARSKDEAEMACISDALERHQNNRLRAAAALGLSRMTLYKKLHKYGLMGT
jgi:DNA-binding NtrC family response regulator